MKPIYRSHRQLLIRLLTLGLIFVAGLLCKMGWDIFTTYGLRAVDGYGGQLAPLATRLPFALLVAAIGLSFVAGMWVYGNLYVLALDLDPATNLLHVRSVGLLWPRRFTLPMADVEGVTWMEGRTGNPVGVSVDAPWLSLRVKGRRLPLILDAKGDFLDKDLAARLP
jgi:hypothetical protein